VHVVSLLCSQIPHRTNTLGSEYLSQVERGCVLCAGSALGKVHACTIHVFDKYASASSEIIGACTWGYTGTFGHTSFVMLSKCNAKVCG